MVFALSGPALDPRRTERILAARCWDGRLNDDLIAECEAVGPGCLFANVAQALALDYCPGECGMPGTGPASPEQQQKAGLLAQIPAKYQPYVGPAVIGVGILVGALILRQRKARKGG